jgi:putative nucleotidyltransferase with HDIG domain
MEAIMNDIVPTREQAWQLLNQYTQSDALLKHALAVEAVMRYFAQKRGHDSEKWGIIGLVHDLDYEQFPQEHCYKTAEILRQNQWPEDYIHAVLSHAWGICTDVTPEHEMEKVLFAVDELTGLVVTTALVRPSRSLADLTVKSVRKKWKDKAFAAKIDRGIITHGAEMLGMELSDLITETIAGMRPVAAELGLEGPA